MKKVFVFVVLVLFVTIQSIEANKPKDDGIILPERMIGQPKKLNYNSTTSHEWDSISISGGSYGELSNNVWTVYVANQNAKIYSSATGSTVLNHTELSFMEDFYVADFSGYRVLLFYSNKKITGLDYSYGLEKKSIKNIVGKVYSVGHNEKRSDGCIGWVNVKDLLLWNICPKTKDGIFKKIAVVKDIDNAVAGSLSGETRAELYADAECSKHFNPARYLNPLDFNYAIKSSLTGNVLVYDNYRIENDKKMYSEKIGWVKRSEFINWNTRICWEPAFRGQINEFAYSFSSDEDAEEENLNHIRSRVKLEKNKRKSAQTFPRFPVVDFRNSMAYLSVLGTGESNVDIEKLQRELQLLENSLNRINIVFVMDATNSMKPCFDAVKRAIDDISNYKYKNDNVYFGVVVYRNYKDVEWGGLDEYLPLTNDCERVSDFLKKVVCRSVSADPQEAMFHGLNLAADKMDWHGSISNFVVLLTDVSTKDPDERGFTSKSIIEKYKNKQINLVSYQVRSQEDISYQDFCGQMLGITKGLLTKYGYPTTSVYNKRTKGFMYSQITSQKKFPFRPMAVRFKNSDDISVNSEELTDFAKNITQVSQVRKFNVNT